MNYYFDLELLPDEEVPIFFIRNKIYSKLHKSIFDLKATDIGVSFPKTKGKVKVILGRIVRIHSNKNRLKELQNSNWLGGLSGYCKLSSILPVPSEVKGYKAISRIRQNMSISRLQKKINHQKSKGYLTTDDKLKAYEKRYKEKMFSTSLDNYPYLELQSTSTDSRYRLYIEFGNLQNNSVQGEFNRFGFSKTATIPVF